MATATRVKVRSWSPTPEQVEYIRAIEPTSHFLHNLPDEIRRQYAGQWVAAKDCQIIAAARTRAELCAALGEPRDPAILLLRLEKGVTIRWRRLS